MKDAKDKATLDAFEAPRKGRPRKEGAMTNAEKQAAYRKRRAEAGGGAVMLNNEEIWLICHALDGKVWEADSEQRQKLIARLRKRVV
ncbi:hypothetical protein N5J43_21885 [Pseudomonas nicosulfuronedens]|uniref:Uncharacterized protein n=1 Tax=Pseudomonas nicosulfuronedens TaxID=2571105 RepID=A0A5R9QYK3_9PSED|nr:hypothetical protein [Pseudomonas nicosulfuronedens]MDH1011909.1 hypothetical protein [Pseudomonas nicosulfuronedens]MDH1981616.1 hypothetical protein [Pseudomonas nicosulfuronedens]MDH2027951.1 hypothetical protein [Pseudomonas nicosulfuronedens]TLX74467.1 hypothetical protein FAS41_18480 [Pseudomonas nicosulfuronedens]